MNRKTLLTAALTALMAGATSVVLAQTPPPPAPSKTASASMPATHAQRMSSKGHRMHNHHRFSGQRGGVIGDLRGLEKLYMQAGRSKDMVAVYNDVLSKSKNPRVRDYAYRHLARLQAKPADVEQSIATLRKALNESLANEAKMRAAHEEMRAEWMSHHTMPTPVAPAK